jgi:mono/diheme cytochrome c family protein
MSRGRAALLLLAGAVLALLASEGIGRWNSRNVSAVQRGFLVAQAKGCFTCHGPGGQQGMANPGHELGEVPGFDRRLHAQSEAELREWILDGLPRRLRADPAQIALRRSAVVRMPAFADLLSEAELRDVLAYVKASADFERPADPGAEEGRQIARRMGCFHCHGPQGRGSMPNLRAFKGYIPAWDGRDFEDLARDDTEIRLWILDGGIRRLWASPVLRFFLERQPIRMPPYRGHLREAEVDRIIDYIHWLQAHPY